MSLQLRQKNRIHATALASRSKGKNMGFKVRHSERELCSSVEGWGHLGVLSLLEGMGARLQGSEPRAPLQTGTRTTYSRRPQSSTSPS